MPNQAEAQKRIIKILEDCRDDQQKQIEFLNQLKEYVLQSLTDEVKIKALEVIEITRVKMTEHKERYESTLKTAIENQGKLYDNELN